MTPLLIQHLDGKAIGRLPVWLMRQAGRYLPAYRDLRKEYSFWQMVSSPELATKVSLLPLETLDVDAVILFSDILTLPYGLKVPIEMKEGTGPAVSERFRLESDFRIFSDFDPATHVSFVMDALSRLKRQIPAEKALIGFAGAPWTVSCYLIDGQGKGHDGFPDIARWQKLDPAGLARALESLTRATLSYLQAQVRAGADIVQLFDTWLSEMSVEFFSVYYLPMLNTIAEGVRASAAKFIYFSKACGPYLSHFPKIAADVISIDSTLDLIHVDATLNRRFSLQGNFDPQKLFEEIGEVRSGARKLVDTCRRLSRPAVVNLGHGVLPTTPVANVQAFVTEARNLWT